MRTLTALALVLATTSFAYADHKNKNESFISQVGAENSAWVFQTGGHNDSAVLQKGAWNHALVDQVADPRRGRDGKNRSFVWSTGIGNSAFVYQNADHGADNNQATIQNGWFNTAATIQTGHTENTAVTLQFGAGNHAFTMQH
jgi:Curlin associated repeat